MSSKIANLWIIDDDPMASFYIKRLAELGELADIITIYDKARGAVDYLLHHKETPEHLPNIILLDIYMPDLDGWGFLQEFSKIKDQLAKNVEVYIISSSGHLKDINRAKAMPEVKGYIQKPVTKEKLRELVKPVSPSESVQSGEV
jgi:response regulator of citrate/malate metabolism